MTIQTHPQQPVAANMEGGGSSAPDLRKRYAKIYARRFLVFGAACILLILCIVASLAMGNDNLGFAEVAAILLKPVLPDGWFVDVPTLQEKIVWQLRLPRVVMAIAAGAGLAVTGVMMQGITRNPLVSPFTIGLSPAAAFGASVSILFGAHHIAVYGKYLTVVSAFVAALVCAAIVLAIAALRGVGATTMILAGIGLTYLFSAFTATIQYVATQEELAAIVHWTFGSLNAASWGEVSVTSVLLLVSIPVFVKFSWGLNALSAGEETALSLGFNVRVMRFVTAFLAVLVTAGVISFTGVIGFVGLVAPHISRMLIGNDHRVLIPFSLVVGALLLLVADTIGRSMFSPAVIPVGIVVAYVGVPLFVHLILSQRREMSQ